MKRGGGKGKGSSFERVICKRLSLWVSRGEDEDLFWRSAISGGRATVAFRKGKNIRAAGDICAVSPHGHKLTDRYFIECKHVRMLNLDSFLFGRGNLSAYWSKCVEQALDHRRAPMLIAKQDRWQTLLILLQGSRNDYMAIAHVGNSAVFLFDDYLKQECKL